MYNNVDIKQELNVKDDECLRVCFFWKDFREDRKFRREKWRERSFIGYLVERERGKKVVRPRCFLLSPLKCFLPKMG